MRFLANENFPSDAVDAVRALGHDVRWVRTDSPGIPDTQVLSRAIAESRTLLTFDKDFGDLAFHAGLPAGCGIVLFRLGAATSAQLAVAVSHALQSRTDWIGHFAVVEPGRVRLRPLPPNPPVSADA